MIQKVREDEDQYSGDRRSMEKKKRAPEQENTGAIHETVMNRKHLLTDMECVTGNMVLY